MADEDLNIQDDDEEIGADIPDDDEDDPDRDAEPVVIDL